jgi:hypothetical protein
MLIDVPYSSPVRVPPESGKYPVNAEVVASELRRVPLSCIPAKVPVEVTISPLVPVYPVNELANTLVDIVQDAPSVHVVLFTVNELFTNDEFGIFVKVAPLPLNPVAVIVPAEKLPDASLETIVEAVLELVASLVIVTADDPL